MAYDQTKYLSADAARGRDTNSIMQGWVDRGPWIYYDTVIISAGVASAQTYYPFSVGIGQPDPLTGGTVKTKYETNMQRGNQFPPPKCMLLFSLGIQFDSTCLLSDIQLAMATSYLEFKIDDKVFHEGYLQFFPGGMGLQGASTNNAEAVWTNGIPAPAYSRRYDEWSKYIAPEQQFSCTWYLKTAITTTADLRMRWTMDGLTDRSVQ